MVKIEHGTVQKRPVAKRCRVSLDINIGYRFVETDAFDIIRNNVGTSAAVQRLEDANSGPIRTNPDKYDIRFGDRIWVKRPEMILSSLRDRIALELIQLEDYDTVEASQRAEEITTGFVYAMHEDESSAEMVLEVKFRGTISEREFEDMYSKFNTRNTFIKEHFGQVERINDETYIFGGSLTKIDVLDLWGAAKQMQDEMKAHDIVISCRPT